MKRYYYFILFLFLITIFNTKVNAQHVDAGEDFSVCQGETEVTLHPNIRVALTQKYTPESIPFQWDGDLTGTEALSATGLLIDDKYSLPVQFPIDFYFLGNHHNDIVIGSNGDVVFNTLASNKYDDYSNFNAGITIPNQVLPYWDNTTNTSADAVYGAAQDLNPAPAYRINNHNDTITTIQYKTVGQAPNRKFIVTYNDIPLFGCMSGSDLLLVSQQIVFYETTDIIEVYIKEKPVCMSWSHHAAAIGVQNFLLDPDTCGTAADPTRNTGDWTVDAASPEGWRFVPTGQIADIKWYDSNRNVVGTTANATVPFSDTETFTLEVTFEDCNGNSYTEFDEVTVNKLPEIQVDAPTKSLLCANETLHFDGTIKNPSDYTYVAYTWLDASGATIGTDATIDINTAGTYTLTITAQDCIANYPFEIEPYPYACKVPEGISPNGDNDNDYFELTYLAKRGEGIDKLEIFDRRGVLVYEKDGYSNEFIGKTNDDKELPAATYFYVIKMMNGEKLTGWLYIVR